MVPLVSAERSLRGRQESEVESEAGDGAERSGSEAAESAERRFYEHVVPEDQFSCALQVVSQDARVIAGLLVVVGCGMVVGVSVVTAVLDIDVGKDAFYFVLIGVLVGCHALVTLRWVTLARIKFYGLVPSNAALKRHGAVRYVMGWSYLLLLSTLPYAAGSAMPATSLLFVVIVLLEVGFVERFDVLSKMCFVVFIVVGLPLLLPAHWCLRRRARRQQMAKLAVVKFNYAAFIEERFNVTCSICLEDFARGEYLRRTECRHCFHKRCLDPWVDRKNKTCPLCRAPLFGEANAPSPMSSSSSSSSSSSHLSPSSLEEGALDFDL